MVGARNKVQFREAVEHFVMKVGPEGSVAEHVEQATTWRWSELRREETDNSEARSQAAPPRGQPWAQRTQLEIPTCFLPKLE